MVSGSSGGKRRASKIHAKPHLPRKGKREPRNKKPHGGIHRFSSLSSKISEAASSGASPQ